jgi:exonuclease VII large subunit
MTHQVHRQKMRVEALSQAFVERMHRWTAQLATRIESSHRLLSNLDPKRILSRGYAIASSNGHVVKDASHLELGAKLTVQFAKGIVDTTVKGKR